MTFVIDASALLSGRLSRLPPGRVITPPEIVDEVGNGWPARMLGSLIDAGLEVISPNDKYQAIEAARRTGDLSALSDADISVIALAMESDDPLVLTDDFRIQNVLMSLGVRFEPAGEIGDRKASEKRNYSFRCAGCGRYHKDELPDCPICGSRIKRVRSRERA